MNVKRVAALLRELADAYERNEESRLYFIQAGDGGPVKIGHAVAPSRRRTELQGGNAETLKLLATFPGGKSVERAAHEAFDWLHVRGEWFRPDPILLDFIGGLRVLESVA